jgi:hypothetical protein
MRFCFNKDEKGEGIAFAFLLSMGLVIELLSFYNCERLRGWYGLR